MLLAASTVIAGIAIMMTNVVPVGYQIKAYTAILPLGMVMGSHILLPMVLNRKYAHVSSYEFTDVPLVPGFAWLFAIQLG